MRTRLVPLIACVVTLMLAFAVSPVVAHADYLPDPSLVSSPQAPVVEPPTVYEPPTAQLASTGIRWDTILFYLTGGFTVFLIPLLVTLVVEVPVVAIAGGGSRGAWKVGLLANTITNPIAVLIFVLLATFAWPWYTSPWPPLLTIAGIEIAVVVAEWVMLKWALGWTNRRAAVVSLIANGLSFGIGAVTVGRALFGF